MESKAQAGSMVVVGGWPRFNSWVAFALIEGHPEMPQPIKGAPPALLDSVFGLFLLTTEPRPGGGATGGDDYVVVGIENVDC